MLEENRGRKRVDITLSTPRGFPKLLYDSQCCRRGKAFIIETNRHTRPFRDFRSQGAHFSRPVGLVALSVEGKALNEALRIQLGGSRENLCDGCSFALAPPYEARRRSNHAERI